ncbi:hypothetical protein SKAU_G00312690 [Synaphobranchus kaupii]|uniref:Reverse transcriptase domain-containing protein n=1 Tax=Synaphobranchus kaupii TaxID=118154 RepID=A0A9Q1ERZ6_SYNKA|nr:hypothetical protein SKAU_G00312690 [Synaphobranchus kaupii]
MSVFYMVNVLLCNLNLNYLHCILEFSRCYLSRVIYTLYIYAQSIYTVGYLLDLFWLSTFWFSNYLSDRVQSVRSEQLLSQPLPVTKGVPQGSILGPTLFSVYINDLACFVGDSAIHLYADDTILYATGPSPDAVLMLLQSSFNSIQQAFSSLHLMLNTSKTKVMWFGKKSSVPISPPHIRTLSGMTLEQVSEYKYLGIWLDNTLSFFHHINKFQAKVKSKIGFLYRMRSSFTLSDRLTLVKMTILPMLDYGDTIFRSACKTTLQKLDVLYHSAIRFATNAPFRTHHCTLYSSVNWPSLHTRREIHWYMLIYKTLLGLSPPYLCSLLQFAPAAYNTRSANLILLKIPKTFSNWSIVISVCCAHGLEQYTKKNKTGQFHLQISLQGISHGHS